jgi:hypothetical protein
MHNLKSKIKTVTKDVNITIFSGKSFQTVCLSNYVVRTNVVMPRVVDSVHFALMDKSAKQTFVMTVCSFGWEIFLPYKNIGSKFFMRNTQRPIGPFLPTYLIIAFYNIDPGPFISCLIPNTKYANCDSF